MNVPKFSSRQSASYYLPALPRFASPAACGQRNAVFPELVSTGKMVPETEFSNAFAADGIVPDKYGLRTVVEYRSQLFSIPKNALSAGRRDYDGDQEMDAITPVRDRRQEDDGTVSRSANGYLRLPDLREVEGALRALGELIDTAGMSALDPKYLAVLQVDRPMFLGGRARPVIVTRQVPDNPGIMGALKEAVASAFPAPPAGREVELSLLSWHWAEDLIAVATGAHLDRICAYNFRENRWETLPNRIEPLSGIRCISFRPFSGRVVAIGCEAGVALLSGQSLKFLKAPGHTRIVCLDWSTDGSKLVTASAGDGVVRMWDIGTRTSIVVGKGGLARFSRDERSQLLFVADSSRSSFRIWNCNNWKQERWGYLSGPITAVTWSPDGMVALFSTEGESAIHVLCIGGPRADDETRVVHTELTGLPREGPGGTPIMLEMDDTGERLAVAYELKSEDVDEEFAPNDDYVGDPGRRFAIALYTTQLQPNFRMSPLGYVSGPEKSGPPVAIKFKPKSDSAKATILSCMWRSGEVTFTQLLFNPLHQ